MFGITVTLLLVVLVGAVQPEAVFSHDFARNDMFPLAAAAYAADPVPCLEEHFGKFNIEMPHRRLYQVDCGFSKLKLFEENCTAFTAALTNKKAIVLSFRGTDTLVQLLREFHYRGLEHKWYNRAYVNEYFGHAFKRLWDTRMDDGYSLSEDIRDLIQLYVKSYGYELWITGHSLGGALASLAASHLIFTNAIPKDKVKLVTFGQPKTGDNKFVEDFNRQVDYSFRVIHGADGVPHIPPNSDYKHHKKEIFYGGEYMREDEFVECNTEEEHKTFCSGMYDPKALIYYTKEDHLLYYGRYPSEWAKAGCPKN